MSFISDPDSFLSKLKKHISPRMNDIKKLGIRCDGLENWFQIETLIAWEEATIREKTKYDSDIVIEEKGVELKIWRESYSKKGSTFINVFKQHPRANYYLFLHEDTTNACQYNEGENRAKNVWKKPLKYGWYLTLFENNSN